MKLDRNSNPSGKGKYAVISLRKISSNPSTPAELAAAILAHPECVEFGAVGAPDEFWLIKLRDQYAEPALRAYAAAARADDSEYAEQVDALADRSGRYSPFCKKPD